MHLWFSYFFVFSTRGICYWSLKYPKYLSLECKCYLCFTWNAIWAYKNALLFWTCRESTCSERPDGSLNASFWCVQVPVRRDSKKAINMAATAKMRTWSCPKRGVFYSWTLFLLVLVGTMDVVVAAPETGLWIVTVVNVSVLLGQESQWITASTGQ